MKLQFSIAIILLCLTVHSEAVIALNSPTSDFNALYLNGESDPIADNQANRPDIELVGNDSVGLYAFYAQFNNNNDPLNPSSNVATDGEVFFRVRVAGDQSQSTLDGFVLVGLDITGDGALDYYISHGGTPTQTISIIRAGASANNSPTTMSLGETLYSINVDSSNSSFVEVDAYGPSGNENPDGLNDTPLAEQPAGLGQNQVATTNDLNGAGDIDHFLTFSLDFQALVDVIVADATPISEGAPGLLDAVYLGFDDTFDVQLLLTTSQNGSNINSDLGGIDGNSSTDPFVDPEGGGSGGLTNPVDVSGAEVPEPSAYAFFFGVVTLGFAAIRRRR